MPQHLELVVTRQPVRDADRAPGAIASAAPVAAPADSSVRAATGLPASPVHELTGLTPEARLTQLRWRVRSGFYARRDVIDRVSRRMLLDPDAWG